MISNLTPSLAAMLANVSVTTVGVVVQRDHHTDLRVGVGVGGGLGLHDVLAASVGQLARRGIEALQRRVLGHGDALGRDQRRQERAERPEPNRVRALTEPEAPRALTNGARAGVSAELGEDFRFDSVEQRCQRVARAQVRRRPSGEPVRRCRRDAVHRPTVRRSRPPSRRRSPRRSGYRPSTARNPPTVR